MSDRPDDSKPTGSTAPSGTEIGLIPYVGHHQAHGPLLKAHDLEFRRELAHGERFHAKIAPVSARLGAKKRGYKVPDLALGKRAVPFPQHHADEELFSIIAGEGTLWFGGQSDAIAAGDMICCLPGDREVAHQLITSGTQELPDLAVSTATDADVFEYPDSNKFGAVCGAVGSAGSSVSEGSSRGLDRRVAAKIRLGRRVAAAWRRCAVRLLRCRDASAARHRDPDREPGAWPHCL